MLSINDLHREVEQRESQKVKIYQSVLDKCIQRIQISNQKSSECCCLFECPTFIFGVPLFDLGNCITFIMNELMKKGFEVFYTHPNLLYISWKKKNAPIKPQFLLPPLDISSTIYHPTDLKSLQDKTDLLLDEPNQTRRKKLTYFNF
jgi:hypothetical protein